MKYTALEREENRNPAQFNQWLHEPSESEDVIHFHYVGLHICWAESSRHPYI